MEYGYCHLKILVAFIEITEKLLSSQEALQASHEPLFRRLYENADDFLQCTVQLHGSAMPLRTEDVCL